MLCGQFNNRGAIGEMNAKLRYNGGIRSILLERREDTLVLPLVNFSIEHRFFQRNAGVFGRLTDCRAAGTFPFYSSVQDDAGIGQHRENLFEKPEALSPDFKSRIDGGSGYVAAKPRDV